MNLMPPIFLTDQPINDANDEHQINQFNNNNIFSTLQTRIFNTDLLMIHMNDGNDGNYLVENQSFQMSCTEHNALLIIFFFLCITPWTKWILNLAYI